MTNMTLLLILVPILLVSGITIILIRWFLKAFITRQNYIASKDEKKHLLSLRIQAYERMALFLERIRPDSLIIREQKQNLKSIQFHTLLVQSIRKEYEHNLAIQIYLSNETWQSISTAREELVKLINTCAAEVQPQSPSIELGQKIIERGGGSVTFHINKAMNAIKKEIAQFY